MDELEQSILKVRATLDKAAQGRNYTLLAATKTQPAALINRLADYGILDYGENRVQEWVEKSPEIDKRLRYHQIGRLQINKIKYIINAVSLIHSVDQVSLACAISEKAEKAQRVVDVLLQVNPALEQQKGGVAPEELPRLYETCLALPNLRVRGLMCMAPFSQDEALVRGVFAKARRLFDDLASCDPNISILSMGMSGDAAWALEEGSTLVRIGTALFGKRDV